MVKRTVFCIKWVQYVMANFALSFIIKQKKYDEMDIQLGACANLHTDFSL